MKKVLIKKETYYDSVFLMQVSKAAKQIAGVIEAVTSMGTPTNVALLIRIGFAPDQFESVRPNDLILAVEAPDEQALACALESVESMLRAKGRSGGTAEDYRPVSLRNAIRFAPHSNLVLISVPGAYAAREARLALEQGRHVMVFSDNVSLEDEIDLKRLAAERGLLMMGPDCGTAIINGVCLGFANRVRRGQIGLVAASGSGLQEVTCCIHKLGAGISQALGTGGRDLKDSRVGGRMMKMGIRALGQDEATRVIVVLSKPPEPQLAREVIAELEQTGKPAVVCFLGQEQRTAQGQLHFADNLTQTASLAVALAGAGPSGPDPFKVVPELIAHLAADAVRGMHPGRKYLRGLYVGGTLADEAIFAFERQGFEIHSNIQPNQAFVLPDARVSRAHTIVDLGDDAFTVGRPHPMIDPSIREERLAAELADPGVAVVLMDFVLGDGAHPDPAGRMLACLAGAGQADRQKGRGPAIVGSITGTDADIQDITEQQKILEAQGCLVMPSNHQAVRLAAAIIKEMG